MKYFKSDIRFYPSHPGAGISAERGSLAQSALNGGDNMKKPERGYSAAAANPYLRSR
jgi:hypothetical protein